MSPKLDAVHTNGQRDPYDASFEDRFVLLNVLEGPPIRPMLELLVAMSGALSKENYVELGPGLWGDCLESSDSKTVIYVRHVQRLLFSHSDSFLGIISKYAVC